MISTLLATKIIAGAGTSSGGATAAQIWNYNIETGVSAKQMMRLMCAVLGGWASQVGNQTPQFSSPWDESKIRIKYQTDDVGNRVKQLIIELD